MADGATAGGKMPGGKMPGGKVSGGKVADLADRLSAVLAEETALLDALDLAGAGGLLARKRDAMAALQGALADGGMADGSMANVSVADDGMTDDGMTNDAGADDAGADDAGADDAGAADPDAAAALRDSVRRMLDLAEANRAAVERGLALQLRLVQAIAQAVPRARASEAPSYQPDGSKVATRPPEAYAFLSRM